MIPPGDDEFDADSLKGLRGDTLPSSAKSVSVGKGDEFSARSWLGAVQDTGMSAIPGFAHVPSWNESVMAVFARIVADARCGALEPDWREIRVGGRFVPGQPAGDCNTHVLTRASALIV